MCLNKTTKAFMCLKPVLFPVLTSPNLAVRAFYVLIFFLKGLCAYFLTAKASCAIGHVLIKNECMTVRLKRKVLRVKEFFTDEERGYISIS